MFNNKYPYTDFHELNLDWIINELKNHKLRIEALEEWREVIDEWKDGIDEWKAGINTWKEGIDTWKGTIDTWKGTIDTWKANIDTWKTNIDTWKANIDTWKSGIDTWKTNITGEVANIKLDIDDIVDGTTEIDISNNSTISTINTNIDNIVDGNVEIDISGNEVITAIQGDITDLENNKQDKLTAGDNITIENNVISATDTVYTAGDNITIENNVISATGGGVGGADWDAQEGEEGFIENKPFDVETEETITICDEIVNYDEDSETFSKQLVDEELLKYEYIGKTIKVTIDNVEYEAEVEGMHGMIFAFYNYESGEILDYPAFGIATAEEEGTLFSQLFYADGETHTSVDSINFKAEINETTITKLDGSKIKVDGDTVKVNQDGELYAETSGGTGELLLDVTLGTLTGTFTCDKTYSEIKNALDNKLLIRTQLHSVSTSVLTASRPAFLSYWQYDTNGTVSDHDLRLTFTTIGENITDNKVVLSQIALKFLAEDGTETKTYTENTYDIQI